jgi:hypothetical protein
VKNLIKKILKEEQEWFEDIEPTIPTEVEVTGKRFAITRENMNIDSNEDYSDFQETGWTGWHSIIGTINYKGETCYIVRFSHHYPQVYMPINDFENRDVKYE